MVFTAEDDSTGNVFTNQLLRTKIFSYLPKRDLQNLLFTEPSWRDDVVFTHRTKRTHTLSLLDIKNYLDKLDQGTLPYHKIKLEFNWHHVANAVEWEQLMDGLRQIRKYVKKAVIQHEISQSPQKLDELFGNLTRVEKLKLTILRYHPFSISPTYVPISTSLPSLHTLIISIPLQVYFDVPEFSNLIEQVFTPRLKRLEIIIGGVTNIKMRKGTGIIPSSSLYEMEVSFDFKTVTYVQSFLRIVKDYVHSLTMKPITSRHEAELNGNVVIPGGMQNLEKISILYTTNIFREKLTHHQIEELEKEFQYCKYLTRATRLRIASGLRLTDGEVKNWFSTRRLTAVLYNNLEATDFCPAVTLSPGGSHSYPRLREINISTGSSPVHQFHYWFALLILLQKREDPGFVSVEVKSSVPWIFFKEGKDENNLAFYEKITEIFPSILKLLHQNP